MKKVSRSINPVKHSNVDNLNATFGQLSQKNKFKTEQKAIFDAVSQIVSQYRKNQEKDLTERNKYLIQFIMDNFQDELKPYIDDFSSSIDIEQIIKDVVSEYNDTSEENETCIKEVFNDIKASIRSLKITQQKQKEQTNNVQVSNTYTYPTNDEIDKIFDDITNNKKIQKEIINKQNQEYQKNTKDIIEIYKKHCSNFSKTIKNQISKKPSNKKIISKNILNFKNRKISQKRIRHNIIPIENNIIVKNRRNNTLLPIILNKLNIFSNKIIKKTNQYIKNRKITIRQNKKRPTVIKKRSIKLRNIFKSKNKEKVKTDTKQQIENQPKKNNIWKVLLPFSLIINKFRKNTKNKTKKKTGFISKMFSLTGVKRVIGKIGNELKTIGIMVASLIKKSFLIFLMTPEGAYTVGFIIGYVYGTIKNLYNKYIKPTVDKTVGKIKGWIDSPSTITDTIVNAFHSVIDPIGKFITEISEPISKFIKSIIDFPKNHKILFWVLTVSIPFLKALVTSKKILQVAKMAGDPIAAIIAAGIFGAALAIRSIFKWKKNENYESIEGKKKQIDKIGGADKGIVSLLGAKDKEKYDFMFQKINDEQNKMALISDSLHDLHKNLEDSESHYNFALEMPDLIDEVFSSKLIPIDNKYRQEFVKNASKWDNIKQIEYLSKVLNIRYDMLTALKASIANSKSSKELEQKLNNLGKINTKSGTVEFSDKALTALKTVETQEGKYFAESKEGLSSEHNKKQIDHFSFKLVNADLKRTRVENVDTVMYTSTGAIPQRSTVTHQEIKGTDFDELKDKDREMYDDLRQTMSEYSVNKSNETHADSTQTYTILKENIDIKKLKGMNDEQQKKYFDDIIKEANKKREQQQKIVDEEIAEQERKQKEDLTSDILQLQNSIWRLNEIIKENTGKGDEKVEGKITKQYSTSSKLGRTLNAMNTKDYHWENNKVVYD